MDLKIFDDKCVRLTTVTGEEYEGYASFLDREYAFHEYGRDRQALRLGAVIFFEDDVADVASLEDESGPFGHFSGKYGRLEEECLDAGTDLIEEVLDSEDDAGILRMLACMDDNFPSLADRLVPGMAPWRTGGGASPEDENGRGALYLGELETMLDSLVKHSGNEEIVSSAAALRERLAGGAYY